MGVAGRMGAGRSSFVAALLRMPDPAGISSLKEFQIRRSTSKELEGLYPF